MSEIEATGEMLLFARERDKVASAAPVTAISPDASLVESVRGGDNDAFGKLYALYSPMVHGILLARVPRSEVDDLVQDIFLVALNRLNTLRDTNAFGGWLAMIARNRAMDFYRQSRETEELSEDMAGRSFHDTEAREVLAVIRQLPEAYRETLVLRLVEGMTGPEIAERTGLKAESVRVNLHRGMKILRERLGITEAV
ncbi:MAG TPA: sigma-70 family RNA polymerase sigma factor [Pyrinomonadaceae bacterium]|jgi:RNA polymerase sigma-70 factor (ECF subfamily)